MNIFDFPMQDFNYLLQHTGKDVTINNNTPTKALIANSKINLNADYRFISTLEPLNRGDLIEWDGKHWLALSEVATQRYSYHKAEMRLCNFNIKMIIDDLVHEFPVIIDNFNFNLVDGQYFSIPEGDITVTMQDSIDIPTGTRFIKMGKAYKVIGKDYTKVGLVTLHCELDAFIASDDIDNEVAGGLDLVYTLSITNGNISLSINDTVQLNATLTLNSNPSTRPIAYTTSNPLIATVDDTGLLTGIGEGTCTITAYMVDMPDISDTIEVEVSDVPADNFTYTLTGASEIISGESANYIANKYNNGILVEDAQFDFEIIPDEGVPASAYSLTIISNNECRVNSKKSYYYITLRATDRDNPEGILEKRITLRNWF